MSFDVDHTLRPKEVIVTQTKVLPPEAGEDAIAHAERQAALDLAADTLLPGGKHHDPRKTYTWPPSFSRERVDWPVFHPVEDRGLGMKITVTLRGVQHG